VMGIPTLMLFKGGKVVERVTGAYPKSTVVQKITPYLAA